MQFYETFTYEHFRVVCIPYHTRHYTSAQIYLTFMSDPVKCLTSFNTAVLIW